MKKLAIIYVRVSTSVQDFNYQVDALNDYANRNDYKVIETVEEKITGTEEASKRKLNDVLEFCKANKEEVTVLVSELSRFGRSTSDVLNTIKLFKTNLIPIYFKKERILTVIDGEINPTVDFMLTILIAISELELSTLKYRQRSGMISKAQSGQWFGQNPPYGYDLDDHRYLKINKKEAEIVKQTFDLFLSGTSKHKIAAVFDANEYPTRFSTKYGDKEIKLKRAGVRKGSDYEWNKKQIANILTQTLYIGIRKYKDITNPTPKVIKEKRKNGEIVRDSDIEYIDINCPELRIISDEIFKKATEIIKSKQNYKEPKIHNYLLDSKNLNCGVCGGGMYPKTYFHKRAKGVIKGGAYYLDSNNYCSNKMALGMFKTNDTVYYDFRHGGKFEEIMKIHADLESIQVLIDEINTNILLHEKQIKKVNESIYRLADDFVKNMLSKDQIIAKKGYYENEISITNSRLTALKEQKFQLIQSIEDRKELRQLILSMKTDAPTLKKMIKLFVKSIIFYPIKIKPACFNQKPFHKSDNFIIINIKSNYDTDHYYIVPQRWDNIFKIDFEKIELDNEDEELDFTDVFDTENFSFKIDLIFKEMECKIKFNTSNLFPVLKKV